MFSSSCVTFTGNPSIPSHNPLRTAGGTQRTKALAPRATSHPVPDSIFCPFSRPQAGIAVPPRRAVPAPEPTAAPGRQWTIILPRHRNFPRQRRSRQVVTWCKGSHHPLKRAGRRWAVPSPPGESGIEFQSQLPVRPLHDYSDELRESSETRHFSTVNATKAPRNG